jgi:hypothetical protein
MKQARPNDFHHAYSQPKYIADDRKRMTDENAASDTNVSNRKIEDVTLPATIEHDNRLEHLPGIWHVIDGTTLREPIEGPSQVPLTTTRKVCELPQSRRCSQGRSHWSKESGRNDRHPIDRRHRRCSVDRATNHGFLVETNRCQNK